MPIAEQLAGARDAIAAIKDVWDTAQLCERQFDAWRATLWSEIRTEEMEEGAKGFVKEVKGLSKKVVRAWVMVLGQCSRGSKGIDGKALRCDSLVCWPAGNPQATPYTCRSARRACTRAWTSPSRTTWCRCPWSPTCAVQPCGRATGRRSWRPRG